MFSDEHHSHRQRSSSLRDQDILLSCIRNLWSYYERAYLHVSCANFMNVKHNLLFNSYGIDTEDKGQDVSISDFKNGYALFCFDLNGGLGKNSLSLIEQANIKVEVYFKTGLTENITAILYGQFTDVFKIDQLRNVMPRQI